MFRALFFVGLLASRPRRVDAGDIAGAIVLYLLAQAADRVLEDLRS